MDTNQQQQESNRKEATSTEEITLAPIKYGDSELSDVILLVDGQEFHVHKMALACRSKYFHSLFFGNFKEKYENRIEIKEVSSAGFRRMMDFMYTGRISDEHPVIRSRKVFRCTDEGNLISEHLIDKKTKFVGDFWKHNSEMVQLAERFDLRRTFQPYLESKLTENICTTKDCFACITVYMFCLIKNLHSCTANEKDYSPESLRTWRFYTTQARISENETFDAILNLLHHMR